MSIASDVRGALKTAFDEAEIPATTYAAVPETLIPPAIAILADSPYLIPNLINKSTIKVEVKLIISCAVAYNSNPGSLDNLEQLIIDVLAALPNGYAVETIDAPTIASVGPSSLLVSDIRVSTYYTEGV